MVEVIVTFLWYVAAITGFSAGVGVLIVGVAFVTGRVADRWGEGRALAGLLVVCVCIIAGACTYASLT